VSSFLPIVYVTRDTGRLLNTLVVCVAFSARQRRQKSCHAMTSGLKRTSEVHSERRVIYRCDATMSNSLSKIY